MEAWNMYFKRGVLILKSRIRADVTGRLHWAFLLPIFASGCAVENDVNECNPSLVNPFVEISTAAEKETANMVAVTALASLRYAKENQHFIAPGKQCFVILEWRSETVLAVTRYRSSESAEGPYAFDEAMREALERAAVELNVQDLIDIGSEVKLIH